MLRVDGGEKQTAKCLDNTNILIFDNFEFHYIINY